MDRIIWTGVALNTIGGLGHHIDHIFRRRAGWPLIDEVNGWTITLLIYVVIFIGVILSRRKVVGAGFWALVSGLGFVYTTVIHFIPGSPDPPAEYVADYGSTVLGALALTWLALMLLSLLSTSVYSAQRWARLRQQALAG